ncbi:HNH endonuclease signature motif containing protein [Pseudarthrobacter cellobiosi]|uniref:HNH endonuclease signature motif containing protein n=1 Tax=Pseudarthrobacter cellobiosi TaxID=2953654 RepID=UPI00208ED1B8|nr:MULTISPECIES: HNH endonuclease signature motif containing protein [unclassified Pseudarthrobacter]MCO4256115.1 HNH endonuclease [Pseudarthrobacter sp. HLT1-5]MCO4275436.1 HNH endonuclease [Pseudarthrobacter sp. HLT3-5]
MDNTAAAGVLEAIAASALQMAGVLRGAAVNPAEGLATGSLAAGPSAACPADAPSTTGPATGSDLLRWQAEACLTVLSGTAGMEAMMAAVKVHAVNGFDEAAQAIAAPITSPADQTAQDMGIQAEVACAMTVSERTASALLGESHALTMALPLTFSALQAGTISWQHARIMVDETVNLDPAGKHALEQHFLDPDAVNPARGCPAGEMVPGRFRHKARAWRERHHTDSIEKRHTRSAADRRVEYSPDRDGMAWLSAYLPADQAAGIWNRTTTAARALQGPDESRTLTQLRADVAAAWLLGGEADLIPSPKAQVLVTVPVFALMGLTDEPAMLDGYGPIPPSMASALAADGAESFHRVLTDPRDGAPLEIGRTSYRVTKAQRQWLRLRDGKCPFPGCSNQSLDNEADHLLAWAHGGSTGISNLGQPCPKHHRLRHTTSWKPTTATKNEPPGWISPTGRHCASEYPDWEPPTWPHQIEEQLGHQEIGEWLRRQDFGPDPQNPPGDLSLPEDHQPDQPRTEDASPDERPSPTTSNVSVLEHLGR